MKGGGQYEKENEKTCGSWSGNCNDRFHAAWMREEKKEKEDGKTSDGKVQLRFATWDDATALTASRNVSINLMRARIRLKLYWKDGDLILIR